MTKRFDEIPNLLKPVADEKSQIRCPSCNKMFCKGKASLDPQEFKCPRCGDVTIVSRAN